MYDIENGTIIRHLDFHSEYIKASHVTQNDDGDKFCLPYYDNGLFKIHFFDQHEDTLDIFEDINEQLGIDEKSRPPVGLANPMINVEFIKDHTVFVNLFHTQSTTNWHFFYDFGL